MASNRQTCETSWRAPVNQLVGYNILFFSLLLIPQSGTVCGASRYVQVNKQKNEKSGRLVQNKPTVYLEFRDAEPTSSTEQNKTQKIQLLLHNNTRWPIYYYMYTSGSERRGVIMLYSVEVEEEKGKRVYEVRGGHTLIAQKLPSGKSISFAVLREHLTQGNRICFYCCSLPQRQKTIRTAR